jgi:hypothetical protein
MKRKRLFSGFLTIIVVLALGHPTLAGEPGLVAYWTFDEGQGKTAHDLSGNGLDGTLNGSPKWVNGQLGGALDFNGSSDFVEIPQNPRLSITGAITIAAWTNMRANSSGEMAIVSKGGWAANDLPYELTEERGGVIFWQFYNDAGRDSCSPNSPSAGEWHHIAATYDGKVFKCYIDGVLGEEWAYAGAMPQNTASVTIGCRSRGGTFFNGMIDDVRLYDRALTAGQIKVALAGGTPVYGKAESPTPADGALAVTMPLLQWSAGDKALFHNVYLGTALPLTEANLVGPRQPLAMFYYVAGLQPGVTYYWRVDEIDVAGVVTTGDVWTFVAQDLKAYYPTPANGANDVLPAPVLTWLPGQTVTKHHVYFGNSSDAVTQGAAGTDKGEVTDPTFKPGTLDSLATYYWRVDELAVGGAVRTGSVWSFTTYLSVDDFESYTDDVAAKTTIFDTWIDGLTNGLSGSTVGNATAPFAEQAIVHGGKQSMPLDFNNVKSPFFSEAEREFAPTMDWTASNADTLVLFVRGTPGNKAAPLYIGVEDASKKSATVTDPDSAMVGGSKWTEWKIPLSSFAGVNLAKVKKLYIGVGDKANPAADGAGRIYIDDIRVTKP